MYTTWLARREVYARGHSTITTMFWWQGKLMSKTRPVLSDNKTSCVNLENSRRWLWPVLEDFGNFVAKPERLQEAHHLKRKNNWDFFFLTRHSVWGDINPIIEIARPSHKRDRHCSSEAVSLFFVSVTHLHCYSHFSHKSSVPLISVILLSTPHASLVMFDTCT